MYVRWRGVKVGPSNGILLLGVKRSSTTRSCCKVCYATRSAALQCVRVQRRKLAQQLWAVFAACMLGLLALPVMCGRLCWQMYLSTVWQWLSQLRCHVLVGSAFKR